MQLVSLTSNHTSFHSIKFKSGVNLILGEAMEANKSDLGKTFNGVGKTMAIKLIDFCLGCEAVSEFEEKLPDWSFTLEFILGDSKFVATRATSKQNRILLNGEEMSLDAYKNLLVKSIFELSEDVEYITWRTLIPRFVRTRKDSYISYDSTFSKETDYQILINKAFLLGFDLDLIRAKRGLKLESDRVDKLRTNIETDEIFKKFFTQDKDVDIELASLDDSIKSLKSTLESFKVSDDYYHIQKEADELKYESQIVKNRITFLLNSIKNITQSLTIRGDVSAELIKSLYEETKINLPIAVTKTLDEVGSFHKSLFEKRRVRLMAEALEIRKQIKILERKRKELGVELDTRLSFLGEHKALDEYAGLNRKLAELTSSAEKFRSYKGLLQEYQNKVAEIALHLKTEDVRANEYLAQVQGLVETNLKTFRNLAKEFYADKASGISVRNNTGMNQQRFDINAHIDDDTSDGVGEVKIFCYDLTLLLTRHSHLMSFVVHDSRLFSNMDPRQRATLFRLATAYMKENNFQYIATVNQDQMEPLKEYYSKEEYKKVIEDNVVLRLTDESTESRLLGVQVNLDYEK